jgi:hypothetical protein
VILVAPAGPDRWFESPFPPPGTCCESAQISFQHALTSSLGLAALGNPDPDLREVGAGGRQSLQGGAALYSLERLASAQVLVEPV